MLLLFGLMVWGPPRIRLVAQHWSVSEAARVAWNLDVERQGFDAANLAHLAVWGLGGAIAAVIVLRQPGPYLKAIFRLPVGWYFAYGLAGVASAAWSPSRGYTLYFGSLIPIGILWLFLIRSRVSTIAPLVVLYVSNLCVWGLLAAFYFVAPEYVGEPSLAGYRLTGGTFDDYGYAAMLTGVGFLTLLVLHREHVPRRAVPLLILGYLLSWVFVFLSQTRVTMANGVIMAALLFCLSRRPLLITAAVLGVLAAIGIGGPLGLGERLLNTLARGESLHTMGTLTGRTVAFEFLLDHWRNSPWVGYGYAAGSRQLMTEFILKTGLGMGAAHDAVSRSLADLGLLGAVLLFASLLHAWILLIQVWRSRERGSQHHALMVHATLLMFYATLRSGMGTGISALQFPFIIAMTIAMDVQRRTRAAADRQRQAHMAAIELRSTA
ncbi:MAG TPA: O-antigen ligase family protein [Gemmatimonadales bacterium]|jgi:O-antigen ligase